MARIMVVTGGSRGIGAATALLGARQGYDVAINYRAESAVAEALVARIKAETGRRVIAVAGDMAVEADIKALFASVDRELGPVSHLVNNAGITGRSGRLDTTEADVIRACIDLNVTGAMLVAREAVRRMSMRHGGAGGAIVNMSSVAARIGSPGEYVWYAASKGAIDAFTLGLAKETALEGIRVNAVSPGMVMTDIHERSTGDVARIERIRPNIPMQRIGMPDEIAKTVLFLLSDEASYTTGAIVDVSGGR
ncbi:MAG: SDR family oxidoreductase [Hyphomicrobiales bacterium]|nr:SDR family oxidoreductase [Hyphomicrobiales bacterium]